MNELVKRRKVILNSLFSLILYVITYSIVWKSIDNQQCDFYNHMNFALSYKFTDLAYVFLNQNSYFMWHLFVRLFSKIFFVPIEFSTAIVTSLINVISFLLVEKIMAKANVKFSETITFILFLVSPIYLPWFNQRIYLGQSSPNVWHNPTFIMVRPFVIICFFLIIKMLKQIEKREKITIKQYLCLSVLLLLSVLAKPSFLQGFIPGLGIYFVVRCIYERFKNIKQYLLICLTFVPGTLLMCYQLFFYFFSGLEVANEGVGIGWMEVLSKYTTNIWVSTLLVLLFPLLYFIFNIKRCYKNPIIQVAFSYLLCSWLEVVLLYEEGYRKYHINFGWAYALSLFIFWTVALIDYSKTFFVDDVKVQGKFYWIKNKILITILGLHLICGIYYIYLLAVEQGIYY